MNRLLLLWAACCLTLTVLAQPAPKHELRAAWIATFSNIDWPKSRSLTADQQRAAFRTLLDMHKATGMNAVIVQVRSQCDAMYESSIEPWSIDLSGTQDNNPGYDPLAFMIEECRARGLEFHAWFNPYRALSSYNNYGTLKPKHVALQHPGWILDVRNRANPTSNSLRQLLLNPGLPEVRDYVIKVIMDVVRRYDVDGIHFDDYFYTNPATTTYNDTVTYEAQNPPGLTIDQWRRSNVDSLIKRLGDSIRNEKPWVKFGISPTGIWMSAANDPAGSQTSAGALQHNKDLFANTRLWQQRGWVDYLMPQVYWWMGQSGSNYTILANWWNDNAFERHMYIGQAGYKVGDPNQGAFNTNPGEINGQVDLNRSLSKVLGQAVYNTTSLVNNNLNFRVNLAEQRYARGALPPRMVWKSPEAPLPPAISGAVQGGQVVLQWPAAAPADPGDPAKVRWYVVYRSATLPVDTDNPQNLLAVLPDNVLTYTDVNPPAGPPVHYVVTAANRLSNESRVSNVITYADGTLPLRSLSFSGSVRAKQQALLAWITRDEERLAGFVLEHSTNGTRFDEVVRIAPNNRPGTHRYEQLHSMQPGENWYRLRVQEADGSYSVSRTILLHSDAAKPLAVARPSAVPAGQAWTITLEADAAASVQYRVLSADGRQLTQGNWPAGASQQRLKSANQPGIYLLELRQADRRETIRLAAW